MYFGFCAFFRLGFDEETVVQVLVLYIGIGVLPDTCWYPICRYGKFRSLRYIQQTDCSVDL